MGKSVSVLQVTDDQIRTFQADPTQAGDLIGSVIPFSTQEKWYLADFWHGVHFLLTQQVEPGPPPRGAVLKGDVHFHGLDDPAHAIYSATTRALAEEMQGLDDGTLRERYDPPRMQTVYPGRYWLCNERIGDAAEQSFPELLRYFETLRDAASEAARQGNGLLFCHHEDW